VRAILDTNVWTYIGERGEREAFEALEQDLDFTVVVPPSLLLEALRTPVPKIRALVVEAMTSRRGTRVHPLPEARLEADEVVAESRRLRPSWLRRFPLSANVTPLERFWTRALWQEAAEDPMRVAAALSSEVEGIVEKIHAVQRENKTMFMEAGFRLNDSEPWVELDALEDTDKCGWEGTRIAAWRYEGCATWWHALVVAPRIAQRRAMDTSYADWAGALLNLAAVARDRASWNHLWYHEVDASEMPRIWLRSVVPWVQLQTRLGSGNARDAQHAAYLYDADVLITADRRYGKVLDIVRNWAPTPFAQACVISATDSPTESIATLVRQFRP
jgi:hypothetical protein